MFHNIVMELKVRKIGNGYGVLLPKQLDLAPAKRIP